MQKRHKEKFKVKDTWTERYKKSAIPYMQKLLNIENKQKHDILNKINDFVPVNNGLLYSPLSLRQ